MLVVDTSQNYSQKVWVKSPEQWIPGGKKWSLTFPTG
jgi:hypothetical protein